MDVLKIVAALLLTYSLAFAAQNAQAPPSPNDDLQKLRTASAGSPNDPELHFRLGDALEKSGDFAGAESEYKKSVSLQPNNPNALGALAYLYMSQRRFPDAEAALRSYVALEPRNAKAHQQLGSVLLFSDKKDEASRELSAALRLATSDPVVLKQVAQLYAAHEMFPQASPFTQT
jgi:Flp pilus assembly protein TadD